MTLQSTHTSPATNGDLSTQRAATGTNGSRELSQQFLQLLVTTLRHQDPLSPQDGTEFLSQLAQMSSVEELTSIRTILARVESALEAAAALKTSHPRSTDPAAGMLGAVADVAIPSTALDQLA